MKRSQYSTHEETSTKRWRTNSPTGKQGSGPEDEDEEANTCELYYHLLCSNVYCVMAIDFFVLRSQCH